MNALLEGPEAEEGTAILLEMKSDETFVEQWVIRLLGISIYRKSDEGNQGTNSRKLPVEKEAKKHSSASNEEIFG